MRSRHKHRLVSSPRLVALTIVAMSCGSRELSVGCSPTPSCSFEPSRFEPPMDTEDAGKRGCSLEKRRCAAESLAAGRGHTCALTAVGEVFCWGDDMEGQLGGSGADAGDAPFETLLVMQDAAAIAAGDHHSCAIDAAGAVHCWGRNAEGQLDGVASASAAQPVAVEGLGGFPSAIAAGGAHTCALVDAAVHCWGSATFGQAGRRLDRSPLEPGLVPGTEGAVELTAGTRHTCARQPSGRVLCWGQLYDGDAQAMRSVPEPQPVDGLDDALQIAAGAGFTCALRPGGIVVCWGDNSTGQLGDGTTTSRATPVAVVGLELSLSVSAGGSEHEGALVGHACAITKSFFAQCWGRNVEGQLAQPMADFVPRATVVRGEEGEEDDEPFLPDITAIATGGFHTCSVDHDGPVLCWGDDRLGQLGISGEAPFGYPVETTIFDGEY